MTSTQIETQLKEMIIERLFLNLEPKEIKSEASLLDDYGVDSVALLELVVGLEEAFGIQLEDGDFNLANFASVATLRQFVEARLPKQS